MRTLLTLAAAFALATGIATAQSPSPSTSPSTSPSPKATPAVVVHIKNFAYAKENVEIVAGQSVQWVQDDETSHTVTASDKSFDSGNLDQHKTYTHVFAKPGAYAYICTYHPYMKGTVVVK